MILDSFRVTDKVAIVTGAGHGIGRAIAVALAEAGADVVCAARTQKDIDETAALVGAAGRTGAAVPCDVLETAQLENLVNVTLERFGRIDILVNNAGGMIPRPSLALSERAFEKIVRFNLTSPFLLTKLVVPHMVKIAGSGVVVNISSGASQQVVGGLMPYGAAKAGLDQMTHMLGANRMVTEIWRKTLTNVGRAMGAPDPVVVVEVVCIDKRRQWRHAGNIRNSATLRTMRHTLTAPVRWIAGRS